MKTRKTTKANVPMAILAVTSLVCHSALAAKPLKVYILAGQSNMEGHASIETFDYIGDDPATKPLLQAMTGPDGQPRVCDDVWISYLTGVGENNGEGTGKLTAGYGSRAANFSMPGGKIGPEFTFGLKMDQAHDGPVLIVKAAWGGKSLHTDFRPPSAGPYTLNAWQLENYPKQETDGKPRDMEQWKADKEASTGHYYRLMTGHVKMVLKDIKRVYPDYDSKQSYELAGFVWFQGWNDMVDRHTYPGPNRPGRYDLYSELLGHLIRDVRKDLSAPEMPFVIGVMGVGGIKDNPDHFRQAMAAPANLPEFQGNVIAVETAPFWDESLAEVDQKRADIRQMGYFLRTKHKNHANKDGDMTEEQQLEYLKEYRAKLITPEDEALWERGASNAGYHYLGSAKTMALIGKALAEACLKLENLQS